MGDVEFFDEDGRILDSCLSGFRKEEMFQYFNKTCLLLATIWFFWMERTSKTFQGSLPIEKIVVEQHSLPRYILITPEYMG
jgi:hypothetical protein